MGAGRPTTYKPEYVEQARQLASVLGATNFELAQFFKVSLRTIYNWQIEYPEFDAALQMGKAVADERVKDSLYRRAVGFAHRSEKVFLHEGQVIRAKIVEQYAPDTTACIFWLKNRDPENWRDRQQHEHSAPGGGPIQTLATLTVDDAARVYMEVMGRKD